MKILHVVLGNPYTHQGGLCRYCLELMESQKKVGDSVSVLYPREYITGKSPKIMKKKENEYYIFDALPVSITYGVGTPDRYMVSAKKNIFEKWFKKNSFDIIHVHSIQGIHKEFFESAKELEIPIIYTTHDYYSFCLRSILVDNNAQLCNNHTPEKCANCNYGVGLSANKQRIIQSNIYQIIKNNNVVKALKRKEGVANSSNNTARQIANVGDELIEAYEKLLNYYQGIMDCISLLHCNSSISAENYFLNYPNIKQRVVSITHSGLKREIHTRKSNTLNIGYMGGMSEHKGYKLLYDALKILDSLDCREWVVHLYGGEFSNKIEDKRYNYGGFFMPEVEEKVWETIDVLVVGSQCWETFGFIVLEALCRGIPVLCSDLVGAKDLVSSIDESFILDHTNAMDVAVKLQKLMNINIYNDLKIKIEQADFPIDMGKHQKEIECLYSELLNG